MGFPQLQIEASLLLPLAEMIFGDFSLNFSLPCTPCLLDIRGKAEIIQGQAEEFWAFYYFLCPCFPICSQFAASHVYTEASRLSDAQIRHCNWQPCNKQASLPGK